MKDINKVTLMGRLGADPNAKTLDSGLQITQFSLATSRKLFKENGPEEGTTETQWHRVVVFGKLAQACANYLSKGSCVYIEGMIKSHSYTAKSGEIKMSFEVVADEVNFISTKNHLKEIKSGLGTSLEQGEVNDDIDETYKAS